MKKNYTHPIMAMLMIFLFLGNTLKTIAQISFTGATYNQDFNTIASNGTANAWTNNSTITGWHLFNQGAGGTAITAYNADNGGSSTGSFNSFGTNIATERALGGTGSGGAYFGSPASGAIAGWIAVAFTNNSGATINVATLGFRGEQWRNGGNTTAQTMVLEYGFGNTFATVTTWIAPGGNFDLSSVVNTSTAAAVDGNVAGLVAGKGGTINSLAWATGTTLWIRWVERNDAGGDHGLAIDDFSLSTSIVTPTPTLSINDVSIPEGNSGTINAVFTVTLNNPTMGMGNVTFNYATADGTTFPATQPSDYTSTSGSGTISFSTGATTTTITVPIIGETLPEFNETFFVNLSSPSSGTTFAVAQGLGTITNDDAPPSTKIHDVQGPGLTTPLTGTQTIEGIVVGDFQNEVGNTRLGGFFVQEEDADADTDPNTSEGIFIYEGPMGGLLKNVAVGNKVSVTGTVSEYNGLTEITVTSASDIVISPTSYPMPTAGTLPFPSTLADREKLEGMLVNIPSTMTITDNYDAYFRGELVIASNGKQFNFTEVNDPAPAPALTNYLADQLTKNIILDDDKNGSNNLPVYHFAANDGISNLRAGSTITGLTGVLDYGFNFFRIRPLAPVVFANSNPRPTTAPVLTGKIKVATFNLLNFFNGNGAGGGFPTSRGAETFALFNSQKAKLVKALKNIDADIVGLQELENDGYGTTSAIQELVNDLNTATSPGNYAFINPGGTLGGDEITVGIIYKPSKVSPVGAALSLTIPTDVFTRSRVPLAQTFASIGSCEKFTVISNHFKSKGSPASATGLNVDQNDGQGSWNLVRTQSSEAIRDWVTSTIIPASGSSDVIILGDINAYKKEDPIKTLEAANYTNLVAGTSYAFDGFFGSLDHLLSSASLTPQYVDGAKYQVNSDEVAQIYQYDGIAPSLGTEFANSDHNPTIASFTKNVAANDLVTVTSTKTKLVDNFMLDADCKIIAKVVPGSASGMIDGSVTIGTANITDGAAIYGPRKYDITPSSNGSATVTLYYTQAEFNTYNADANKKDLPINAADLAGNKANLLIFKKSGAITTEIDPVDANIVFTNNRWEVTFEIGSFSEFFLGSAPVGALPVRLTNFTANKTGENENTLVWNTTDQVNFANFEIQKSNDSQQGSVKKAFESIGTVSATNFSKNKYQFVDNQANNLINYYRLKMNDLDGKFEYSKIVSVTNEPVQSTFGEFYPNPALEISTIEITANKNAKYKIIAHDLMGRVLYTQNQTLTKGLNFVKLSTANLVRGINFIRIETNGISEYRKLIKE